MTPTQTLKDEHVLIVKMLDIVAVCGERVKQGDFADLETILQAADFFKNYADGFHHAKEEDILFPLLAGKANMAAPVRAYTGEHAQGRRFIQNIISAVERIKGGDRDAGALLAESIEGYRRMLARHIDKEDRGLFPSTDKILDAAEKSRLLAEFNRVDQAKGAEADKYRRLVGELARRCGVD